MQKFLIFFWGRTILERKFRIYLLVAILIPIYFLWRMGTDSIAREAEGLERRIFDRQIQLIDSQIESIYRSYYECLKEAGSRFMDEKVMQTFKGSSEQRIWVNRSKRVTAFLEQDTSDKGESTRKSTLRRNHQVAYTPQRIAYRDFLLDGLFHIADREKDSPIRIQAYVLEKSLGYKNVNGTSYDYSAPDFKPGDPYLFDRLVPPQYRPKEALADRVLMQKHLQSFKRWDYCDQLPLHPIFLASDPISQLMWDEILTELPRNLFRHYLFGQEIAKSAVESTNNVFNQDFLKLMGTYTSLSPSPDVALELYWNAVPKNFNHAEFIKPGSKIQAPDALLFALIMRTNAENYFLSWFEPKKHPKTKTSPNLEPAKKKLEQLRTQLQEALNRLQKQGIGVEILRYKINEKVKPNVPENDRYNFLVQIREGQIKMLDGKKNYHGPMGKQGDTGNWNFQDVLETIGIMNPKNGDSRLSGEDLRQYIARTAKLPLNQVQNNMASLTRLTRVQNKPIHFVFQDEKLGRTLGTLYPSTNFYEACYLVTQSAEFLSIENQKNRQNLMLWLGTACLLPFLLSFLLRNQIIWPIQNLMDFMHKISLGDYRIRYRISSANEIGQLAARFNAMASSIALRMNSMQAVGQLNSMMGQGAARETLLKFIFDRILEEYQPKYAIFGCFERDFSRKVEDYLILKDKDCLLNEAEILKTLLQEILPSQNEGMNELIVPTLAWMGYADGHLYLILPKLDEQSELPVKGFLLLAPASENQDFNLLNTLMQQVRTVVIKTYLDVLQQDTSKGQEVQNSLMPNYEPDTNNRLDVHSSFVAARGLAGDYYDYLEFEDKRYFGVAIADVSGKGIGPSLFGATSRAMMKILAQDPVKTGICLEQLNTELCEGKNSSLFLTMFYAVFDTVEGKLYFSSAGHNKMFLIRQNNQIEMLSAKGMPMGVFSPSRYETKMVELKEGEILILYTDGVTEMENPSQELFGMERFEVFCRRNQTRSASAFVEALNQELEEFRQGIALSDDLTLIVIKVRELKT